MAWTEETFESDLAKISAKDFSNLSYPQVSEVSDPFLRYRHEFIQLLDAFERNDFARSKSLANSFAPGALEYLNAFDPSSLTRASAAPPFDHMLLAFMRASAGQPTYALFVKLFRHYQRVRAAVAALDGRVFLNDCTRPHEVALDQRRALAVVQARIDYLAELVASLLYSGGQHQLLSAFLGDFAAPGLTDSEETLSNLGRLALACGDGAQAVAYFKRVTLNRDLVIANQGYVSYFGNNFPAARKEFLEAKAAGPANPDVCLKHAGQLAADPTEPPGPAKKPTPEERTQWPLPPRS
jgi:hypothetical protein